MNINIISIVYNVVMVLVFALSAFILRKGISKVNRKLLFNNSEPLLKPIREIPTHRLNFLWWGKREYKWYAKNLLRVAFLVVATSFLSFFFYFIYFGLIYFFQIEIKYFEIVHIGALIIFAAFFYDYKSPKVGEIEN